MNRIYGRPRSNPNRWMINYVPVVPHKRKIDWLVVIGLVEIFALAVWAVWALVIA